MVSISVLLPTARESFSIIGQPNLHIFASTIQSLRKQTFTDWELIIVDALYEQRMKEKLILWGLDESKESHAFWDHRIRYLPVHPNHRYWLDRGRWGVCGQLNSAIIGAEGELLCRLDDCSAFDPGYLQRIWDEYQATGRFLQAMHTRYRNGKQAIYDEEYRRNGYDTNPQLRNQGTKESEERLKFLDKTFGGGKPVRDTRWSVVEQHGGRMIAPSDWFYGYSSVSLEAALTVNGFNEAFDGDKGQEDQEMGLRLSLVGYKDMFVLDVRHWVIEHEHGPVSEKLIPPATGPTKCNFAIYLLNQEKKRYRANSSLLTREDCDWIRLNLCPKCPNHERCQRETLQGKFYVDEDLLRLFLDGQRMFDLREERLTL